MSSVADVMKRAPDLETLAHSWAAVIIIYYIADLPVTRLRLLTNKSDNIAVPYASLRSLILLLSSFELRLFFQHMKTCKNNYTSART